MSGKRITDQQIRLYMMLRKDTIQEVAAAKAGISVRSARRAENGPSPQPSSPGSRPWRTREDPLLAIWEPVVVPLLERSPTLTAIGLFDHLCEHHAHQFDPRSRRTLERRVQAWRQLHGPDQDVVFVQTHAMGELGIADFTVVDEPVTVRKAPLAHRLFHYRLVASGWAYAQVVCGGESFSALSEGLQQAFWRSGGVPRTLRTDSLSAAYKNRAEQDDFTQRFEDLCKHYGIIATRNNRGVAHENGAIESPNNHIKRQLKQALLLRNNYDFDSVECYNEFIGQLVARRNRRVASAFKDEQRQLQPLPAGRSVNYTEHTVRVTRSSTIELKRVLYTVPSRLIGSRVNVRLFDTKLEIWCAQECTLTLTRVHGVTRQRVRSVDYRHVIEGLVKKPRAFRYSQLREDLLPSMDYQLIWASVDRTLSADAACQYIVRLLHLAKKTDNEGALGRYVLDALAATGLPSIAACEQRFLSRRATMPTLNVRQHALSDYDLLNTAGGIHG
ncbi:IS21 family transposase [Alcaligenaceae bacterium]|nr:IS21 family transposase [Alcaligenaceae bacterium]